MIPCHSCRRFVRTDVPHCPFCGSGIHTVPSPLTKAAMGAAMGAILGLTLTACGGAESEDTAGSTSETNMEAVGEAYGAPEFDTGLDDSNIPPDQTTDDGGSSSGMSETGSSSGSGSGDSTGGSSTGDGGMGSGSSSGSESGSGSGSGSSSG